MQPETEGHSTWLETLAGVFIFLQFPFLFTVGRYLLPGISKSPAGSLLPDLAGVVLFISLWFVLPLAGFSLGWLRGFPRWAYPYATFSVIVSLFLMRASTPGLALFGRPLFGGELWGWRACLPGLLVAALVLLVSRSPRRLLAFFENGWKDWTRFTFALFGAMPLLNLIAFDEVRDEFEMPYQVAFVVIMALSAVAYLRSATYRGRVLSLVAGIGLCILIDTVGPTLYWLENGFVSVPGMAVTGVVVFLVLFLPALIGLLRRFPRLRAA